MGVELMSLANSQWPNMKTQYLWKPNTHQNGMQIHSTLGVARLYH